MEVTAKDAHNLAFASYSATIMLVILGSARRSRTHLVVYGQKRFRPTAR
jgi:hypothetical protein